MFYYFVWAAHHLSQLVFIGMRRARNQHGNPLKYQFDAKQQSNKARRMRNSTEQWTLEHQTAESDSYRKSCFFQYWSIVYFFRQIRNSWSFSTHLASIVVRRKYTSPRGKLYGDINLMIRSSKHKAYEILWESSHSRKVAQWTVNTWTFLDAHRLTLKSPWRI